jgi:hypothetical protein
MTTLFPLEINLLIVFFVSDLKANCIMAKEMAEAK